MYTIKVNNVEIDIDGDSAIGITRRGFNFQEPQNLGLSSSNTFSVPATAKNSKIFGFSSDVSGYTMNNDGIPYSEFYSQVYADGILVLAGKSYLTGYSGRYNIKIVDSRNIFDRIGNIMLSGTGSLTEELCDIINDETGPGSSYNDYISYGSSGAGMLFIPYSAGGLYNSWPYLSTNSDNVDEKKDKYEEDGTAAEDYSHMCTEFISGTRPVGNYKGGHFFVSVKTVIETIFSMAGADIISFPEIDSFIRIPDMILYKDIIQNTYYLKDEPGYLYSFSDTGTENRLTALDILKVVMQEYCLVLDVYYDSISERYKCKFTSLNSVPADTFELKTASRPSDIKYLIEGYSKKSWIAYSGLGGPDDSVITGGLKVEVENESLEEGGDETVFFTINRYLGSYLIRVDGNTSTDTVQFNLTEKSTYDKIIIVDKGDAAPYTVTVQRIMAGSVDASVSTTLYTAVQSTVGTSNDWNYFENFVRKPVIISIDCIMNPVIFNNVRQDSLVRFSGIPGRWYVTSIENYNPDVSNITKVNAILFRE